MIYALIYIIDVMLGLYATAVLLRFLLQWTRASFYNPLAQAIVRLTNPLLLPLRRLIPGWRGLDLAALLLTFLIQLLNVAIVCWLLDFPLAAGPLLWWTLLRIIYLLIMLFTFTILIEAVLSWLSQARAGPGANLLWSINAPILRPLRRHIPPVAGLDFSPLIALVALQAINIALGQSGLLPDWLRL